MRRPIFQTPRQRQARATRRLAYRIAWLSRAVVMTAVLAATLVSVYALARTLFG
jgi:hypothetical protein